MNNHEHENWVLNDEGLYLWWKQSQSGDSPREGRMKHGA